MGDKSKHHILVVEDESDIAEMLEYNLEKEGYKVKVAGNGKEAVEIAADFKPEIVLLDIMMPVMDGVEACRIMRENPDLSNMYIIFLTARAEEYSEIAAFNVGADDYIVKPIKPRALMSRIAAYFRREVKSNNKSDIITAGDIVIDKSSYTVKVKDKEVILPKKEFELLYFLAENPNKVFNRDELLKNIWGTEVYVLARTVDVHIRKVREKIGSNYISTVKGVGYKFEENNV